MFETVLVANAIWFGLGFHLFSLRSKIFAKIIVPREHRDTPVLAILAASGKFLGGFNFALCAFNILLLLNLGVFAQANQRAMLCAFFAIAHGSQFFFNLPIALDNRKGAGVWQVRGLMGFIFVTDFSLMIANAAIGLTYL